MTLKTASTWLRFGFQEACICLKNLWISGFSYHTGLKVQEHQKWFFRRPIQCGFSVMKSRVSTYTFVFSISRKIIMDDVVWRNNIFLRKLNVLYKNEISRAPNISLWVFEDLEMGRFNRDEERGINCTL